MTRRRKRGRIRLLVLFTLIQNLSRNILAMIYLTRQEQRIVILLGIVTLLGVGLLLAKRFQPGWVMRLSLGKPDFDTARDEVSPRLTSSSSAQKQESEKSDNGASPATVQGPKQEAKPLFVSH